MGLGEHGEGKRRAVLARETLLVAHTGRGCEYLRVARRVKANPPARGRAEIDPPAETARRVGHRMPVDVINRQFVQVSTMTITTAAVEAHLQIAGIVENKNRRSYQELEAALSRRDPFEDMVDVENKLASPSAAVRFGAAPMDAVDR